MQEDQHVQSTEPPRDDLIGLRAAAEQLGVHYMTVYRYVRLGTLPARKVKGAWQVRLADLWGVASRDEAGPGPGGVQWGPYCAELRDRAVAGDEPGAWSVVERARVSGATAEDIHLKLIAPVLAGIGDAWGAGELDIATEHRASGVATRLIGRLGPSLARRGRKSGTVIIGAAAADHHSIPLAILGDIVRGRGLNVVDLGANTPAATFLDTARAYDNIVAVAIGVGSDDSIESARHTARLFHNELPGSRVFIGGSAITDEREARVLGADEYGATALDVALCCVELAAR
ncbi:MAG: hypothetical protein FJW88_11745 [Actinobacteria bacterium]|nr:hypothetical protein [Actinomycetota bacterium]